MPSFSELTRKARPPEPPTIKRPPTRPPGDSGEIGVLGEPTRKMALPESEPTVIVAPPARPAPPSLTRGPAAPSPPAASARPSASAEPPQLPRPAIPTSTANLRPPAHRRPEPDTLPPEPKTLPPSPVSELLERPTQPHATPAQLPSPPSEPDSSRFARIRDDISAELRVDLSLATPTGPRRTPGDPGGEARTRSDRPPETEHLEVRARPAALWRRLCAWIVDLSALTGVVALYLAVGSLVIGAKAPDPELGGIDALVARLYGWEPILLPGAILAGVLALAYTAAFALAWDGCTLGRRLLGIRLVDRSGLPPTPTRAVIRAVLSALSVGLFFFGFWLAVFDRRGQTLHDKLTATFVVRPS